MTVSPPAASPIILIGFMGSGKSSVARRLARLLRRKMRDLDTAIEAEAGCTVAQLFAREGEEVFRARETEILRRALQNSDVVATGGGIVTRAENRDLLQRASASGAHVVYLRAQPATLAARIRRQPGKRPLIDGAGEPLDLEATQRRVEELLAQREAFYESCATLIVDSDGLDAQQAARYLSQHLGSP